MNSPLSLKNNVSGTIIISIFLLAFAIGNAAAIATITPITASASSSSEMPVVYGNHIVWQASGPGNYAIYLYDTVTGNETRVSVHPSSNQKYPALDGNLIAYQDDREGGNSDIFLYNVVTGEETQITNAPGSDQSYPAVSGNRIVWQDNRNGVYNIFINGTSPGTENAVSPNMSGNQMYPAISGDLVTWQDDRNGNLDIYMINLTSHEETRLTNDPNNQQYPALSGNRIVWMDNRNINPEIFINGTVPGLEYSLTPGLADGNPNEPPAFSGSSVIWAQGMPLENTIFGNNTITGEPSHIGLIPGSRPLYPRIHVDPITGTRIVWEEAQDPVHQIYLYSSGGPGTCPVANFSTDFAGGAAPVLVHFTDTSSPGVTHWFWDFGDGSNSTQQNPQHSFTQNLPFTVTLTVGNPYCRNTTIVTDSVVVGRPVANFVGTPTADIMPATITFTDQSSGAPTSWTWDFGDLSAPSAEQNPVHTYASVGKFTVTLSATNAFGANTKIRTDYISVLNGANAMANSSINGLTFDRCIGAQNASVNTTILQASLIPNSSVLEIQPPADRGFRNITLFSFLGPGFSQTGSTITGRITGVHMESEDISPTGFSTPTGSDISVNYSIDFPSYPCNSRLNMKVWEGAIADDADKFERIAIGSNFAHYSGSAYTAKIIKTNFPGGATAKIRMSVNSTWITSRGGSGNAYIERIADDSLTGEVLTTRFMGHDSVRNLDFFEADSPRGLSTFGLSSLTGSGNPFQLISLSVAAHVEPDSSGIANPTPQPAETAKQNITTTNTSSLPDPGKTTKIYTNAAGVVTQESTLTSSDSMTTFTVSKGIVALDSTGAPLQNMSLRSTPVEAFPTGSPGSGFLFAGAAYEITPEGATFSPGATVAMRINNAGWNEEYFLKSYDHSSGTWRDIPAAFNTSTGVITGTVPHFCCIALFVRHRDSPVSSAVSHAPMAGATPAPQFAKPPAPVSVVTLITGMIVQNVLVIAAVIIVAIILLYMKRRGKMDRIRYGF